MTKEELQPYFDKFVREVELKMEKGRNEYGSVSFDKHPTTLLLEIQEELIDICGWSIILWTRLERIKQQIIKD